MLPKITKLCIVGRRISCDLVAILQSFLVLLNRDSAEFYCVEPHGPAHPPGRSIWGFTDQFVPDPDPGYSNHFFKDGRKD